MTIGQLFAAAKVQAPAPTKPTRAVAQRKSKPKSKSPHPRPKKPKPRTAALLSKYNYIGGRTRHRTYVCETCRCSNSSEKHQGLGYEFVLSHARRVHASEWAELIDEFEAQSGYRPRNLRRQESARELRERIRELEAHVAQLEKLLSKQKPKN